MIAPTAHAGLSLLMQVARSDTTLVRQVGQVHDWFEILTAVASGLLTLAFVILVALLVGAALELRRVSRETHAMLMRFSGDATPLIQQVAVIVTNVYTMSTTLREQLDKVQGTIDHATDKLKEAVVSTEEKLNDFNALLTVVQEEAEGMFVATAATARGVRAGASSLHHADELAAEDDEADDLSEELNDGFDDPDGSETWTTGPRIRTRRR